MQAKKTVLEWTVNLFETEHASEHVLPFAHLVALDLKLGKVIESLIQNTAHLHKLENTIYIMSHYTAGVILFGDRETVRRQSLSKVNFDNYSGILACVNINHIHWKLLYINAEKRSVYLIDPMRNSTDLEESERAAARFCQYLKMRRTCHSKTDWVDLKLQGHVMDHPYQQDGSNCGVLVFMMAKAVMEAFPGSPHMAFGTKMKAMIKERQNMALAILHASVFDIENHCAMCSAKKPPTPGPAITEWIQCDDCDRWFHADCLQMENTQLANMKNSVWKCCLCN